MFSVGDIKVCCAKSVCLVAVCVFAWAHKRAAAWVCAGLWPPGALRWKLGSSQVKVRQRVTHIHTHTHTHTAIYILQCRTCRNTVRSKKKHKSTLV